MPTNWAGGIRTRTLLAAEATRRSTDKLQPQKRHHSRCLKLLQFDTGLPSLQDINRNQTAAAPIIIVIISGAEHLQDCPDDVPPKQQKRRGSGYNHRIEDGLQFRQHGVHKSEDGNYTCAADLRRKLLRNLQRSRLDLLVKVIRAYRKGTGRNRTRDLLLLLALAMLRKALYH